MKIGCYCGATIFDQTDDLPQKGHLIPDQEWFGTYDMTRWTTEMIVPLIDGRDRQGRKRSHVSRRVISRASRLMYQCSVCGRLYIDDRQGVLHCYVPSDDAQPQRKSLRGRGDLQQSITRHCNGLAMTVPNTRQPKSPVSSPAAEC